MVRDISLKQFAKLRESGELSNSRYDVIRILLEMDMELTRAEIAYYSQITSDIKSYQINSITPRVKELIEMGYLVETGIKKCSITGNNAHTLKVVQTADKVA